MSSISSLQSWNPAWSEATGVTVRPATKANWMSAAFLIAIVPLIFSFTVTRRLDHDEHQFVASAALLARDAQLPYRDYPYFHTPGLVFVDALLFRFTNHLLLAARLVSFAGGLATNIVIFFAARIALKDRGTMFAFCGGAIATLLVMTNPMFVATEGRAWNHDLPVFFTLLAFLFACSPRRYDGATAWMLLVGFLVGVAISARLTFAPIVPVFAAIAWMNSRSANRRAALLRYVIGLTIGLSPALFFLVTSPQQFMFGNFDYPMLSTAYWIAMGNKTAAQPLAKLLFVLGHFVCEPENLFLIGAVLWILAANRGRLEPGRLITQRRFLPLLILYLLIGSFAPAPSFRPYFYAPIPFIVLWCVYTLADMPQQSSATRRAWRFSGCAAALAIVIGAASYRDISQLAQPNGWWPLKVHDAGVELARIAGNRRVLTFEPIYALEGGCDIYPQFATGVFAIRTAVTLVEDQEEEYRDWDDADLIECFEAHPPLAILIGNETESEQLVSRFVEKNGYKANPLHLDREVLWISPQSARAEIEYSKTSGLSAHDADADPAGGR